MTLGKKLYLNFGYILGMVLLLFIVNWLAVRREHAAKDAAAASLKLAETTNTVRSQMMQNRLYLSNYLLSGDTREVDRMNEGLRTLNEKLEEGKTKAAPSGGPWINTNGGFLRFVRAAAPGAVVWLGNQPPDKTVITADRYMQAVADAAGLRQCHGCRVADLLPTEGRFFLGQKFDRRSRCG